MLQTECQQNIICRAMAIEDGIAVICFAMNQCIIMKKKHGHVE
jgi:hypothetical protein